jgi:NAD(P)-dependent dehydrogenase (short-subunit alcohol dehydrogenase family)
MTEVRRFENKVVLITGAASGFGRRAAERFAGEGARLVLGDIQDKALEATADLARKVGAEVVTRIADVSSAAQVEALVRAATETFGRLDIALNNAGIAHATVKLQDIDEALMRKMLDVNVMGVFHGLKAQIPVMEKQGSGVILNTASVAGVTGAPLLAAYAAAKHAVIGLTRTAAAETARKGLRINAICPAFAETPMLMDSLAHKDSPKEDTIARLVQAVPMRRPGTADEIVQAMLWICSPENSFMTGHALVVDGGLTAI